MFRIKIFFLIGFTIILLGCCNFIIIYLAQENNIDIFFLKIEFKPDEYNQLGLTELLKLSKHDNHTGALLLLDNRNKRLMMKQILKNRNK